MRSKTNAAQDRSTGVVPTASWRVAEVTVLPGCQLQLRFFDGLERLIDMSALIPSLPTVQDSNLNLSIT
jgi:hypothetical protein